MQDALPLTAISTVHSNPSIQALASGNISIGSTTGFNAPGNPALQVLPGPGPGQFILLVNNTGNTEDQFAVSIVGKSGPITGSLMGLDGNPTQSIALSRIPGLFTGAYLPQADLTAFGTGVIAIQVSSLTRPTAIASVMFTLSATQAATSTPTTPGTIPAGPLAVGAGAGALPQVTVYDGSGQIQAQFYPYPTTFPGGVRTAYGDVNGDGVLDLIVGAGPDGGPEVRVFDGKTLQPLMYGNPNPGFATSRLGNFYAILGPTGVFTAKGTFWFTGGVFVAAGDVNGDGFADVIVGADAGGGPQVTVWSGKDGHLLESFNAFNAPSFGGGVRVAAADMNGDGLADIICGAGAGGMPEVAIYRGTDLMPLLSYFAFPTTFRGGLYVAGGDLNGDGKGEVVVGAGAGGVSQVEIFDGSNGKMQATFDVYPTTYLGGVPVAVRALGNGNRLGIVTGAGSGGKPQVNLFGPQTLAALDRFFTFDPAFGGGAYVGA